MKIIIDAMGGDNTPLEIVRGAIQAHEEFGVDISLVGQGVILRLEFRTLDNRQISFLQVMHALVEYLRYVSTSELSVKTVFVNLIIAHIFNS